MRNSFIKKLKYIVIILTCLVMASLGLFGVKLYQKIFDLGGTWRIEDQHHLSISADLDQVIQGLGYAGMIHHFKNYILRQDETILPLAKERIESLRSIIKHYRTAQLTAKELSAIQVLELMVNEYGAKLELAQKLFAQGFAPIEVDRQVKVEDGPSVLALKVLIEENRQRNDRQHLITELQLNDIFRFLLLASPLIPFAFLSGILGLFLLIKLERFNQTVEESHENLSNLIKVIPSAVVIFTEQGKILRSNENADEMFGYSQEDFGKLNSHQLLSKDPKIRLGDTALEMTYNINEWVIGKVLSMLCQRSNGDIFPAEVKMTILDKAKNHIVASISDVSEHKQVESLLLLAKQKADSANRAKSAFLANMSHEIRTPMNAIIGLTHLSLQYTKDSRQLDYLQKVNQAANQLLRIINDILDFSKIEAGKLEMEDRVFSIIEVLENLNNLVAQKAQEKNLSLLIFVEPDVPDRLIGDSLRLGQVLLNLCNNAIKFTESGSIELHIQLENTSNNLVQLHFEIKDSGIGMSAEQLSKLFTPFTQADGSITRNYGGTGLGLVISQRLVGMMKGEIWAKSDLGEGTSFEFTAQFEFIEGNPRKKPQWENLKTLLIEPDPKQRQVFLSLLHSFGLQADGAESGEQGIRMLEEASPVAPYWLLLTETQLPDMDGLTLVQWIQEHLWPEPRIILQSEDSLTSLQAAAAEMKLYCYLSKPIGPSSMLNMIYRSLSCGESSASLDLKATEAKDSQLSGQLLLVEDNEINQQVATEMIESRGIEVTIASNGVEAIKLLGSQKFGLVLMDIEMPLLDGYQTTRQIRNTPNWSQLPIVAMTAHAMVGVKEKCAAAGMNGYLTKPVNPKQLFGCLSQWFSTSDGDASLSLPSPQEAGPFPEAPGFDFQSSLERMNGNAPKLLRLLNKFTDRYSTSVRELGDLLNDSQYDEAKRLCHSLKGVCASLGAVELSHLFEDCETFIKEQATLEKIPLQATQAGLENFISLIANITLPAPTSDPFSTKDRIQLAELARLLTLKDFQATHLAKQIAQSLRGTDGEHLFSPCVKFVHELHFERALHWCHSQGIAPTDDAPARDPRQSSILILDIPQNIEVLATMLTPSYQVRFASKTREALELASTLPAPDLLIIDIGFLGFKGSTFFNEIKSNPNSAQMPIILMSEDAEAPATDQFLELGVSSVLSRPINPSRLRSKVKGLLAQSEYAKTLVQELGQKNAELSQFQNVFVDILSRVQGMKDPNSVKHLNRIKLYTSVIAREMGLTEPQANLLRMAVQLRDIGNAGIPEELLHKASPLVTKDWDWIKRHVEFGAEIIGENSADLFDLIRQVALTHHEKFDGTGYPHGLVGDQIPIAGQITSLVDVFDALTSDREYRPAFLFYDAVEEIRKLSGTSFSAQLVESFNHVLPQLEQIYRDSNEC